MNPNSVDFGSKIKVILYKEILNVTKFVLKSIPGFNLIHILLVFIWEFSAWETIPSEQSEFDDPTADDAIEQS